MAIDETGKNKSKSATPSFFVLCEEDSLNPGESCFLRVYFEPKYDDILTADLVLTVDGNYRHITIKLQGHGQEPILEISQENINFEPVIPYTDSCKYVAIRNASKFPVEFFFSDFDKSVAVVVFFLRWNCCLIISRIIIEEEAFVRYYALSHQLSKVYFPYRAPGQGIPDMFYESYKGILHDMKQARNFHMKSLENQSGNMLISNSSGRTKSPKKSRSPVYTKYLY